MNTPPPEHLGRENTPPRYNSSLPPQRRNSSITITEENLIHNELNSLNPCTNTMPPSDDLIHASSRSKEPSIFSCPTPFKTPKKQSKPLKIPPSITEHNEQSIYSTHHIPRTSVPKPAEKEPRIKNPHPNIVQRTLRYEHTHPSDGNQDITRALPRIRWGKYTRAQPAASFSNSVGTRWTYDGVGGVSGVVEGREVCESAVEGVVAAAAVAQDGRIEEGKRDTNREKKKKKKKKKGGGLVARGIVYVRIFVERDRGVE
jgi:hypothetical protein